MSITTDVPPSQPPSYDFAAQTTRLNDDLVATPPVPDLPAYTTGQRPRAFPRAREPAERQNPQEYYYELKKRGKAFAILTITTEGTYHSKHMPTFVEGQPIKGRVQLILDKPDPIQSVVLTVLGQFITGANQGEQLSFIDITHVIWTQADGEPKHASASDDDSSPPSNSPKFTGKLQGEYTWPFSIDLPKEVVLTVGHRNEHQVFHPPQTFSERHTRATISYEICLKLMRNKLRADHRIPAQFGYIPITLPPPLPPLRRLAYEQGTPLIGPTSDPDGWHASETIRMRGSIFNTRSLHMECQLFLAKPLSYTRGSVIPMCLRLASDDRQAVDLVSSIKSIVVRLRRRIKYHHNSEKTLESLAWRDAIDHSQLAVWWPSAEGSEDTYGHIRFVSGELHLRPDIKPTSAMGPFRIEYSVVLFPFDAVGIELAETDPLIEVPVDIVTAFARGPRPRMLAPPGYESDIPVHSVSNVVSYADIGYL
ncbi:hypothetical protein BDN70DRAFT_996645 [Pholiota conissans]|uniref:Arrestin-like N-terminal domain-containing protein n=1 Tax=Pholiota conissans TaxID=109636 RepID=A0A9P6CPU9_9AGAR|nr:hypothetical protein BDN70DRAFT_996645 [Pholiota conissans]